MSHINRNLEGIVHRLFVTRFHSQLYFSYFENAESFLDCSKLKSFVTISSSGDIQVIEVCIYFFGVMFPYCGGLQ